MSIKSSINALSEPEEKPAGFGPAPAVGARLGGVSVGRQQAATGSGSGVSASYTEADYASRLHHASRTIVSADGFFRIIYPPPARIVMTDDDDNIVEFNFAEPT